jgi:UDP-N-acetyl-D-mannosaminuronate dehydrogenase
LGISFKAGSDDIRNSPSAKLVELLKGSGAEVLVHDPYVKNTLSLSDALKSPEVTIIATNHKEFLDKIEDIRKSESKIIYDVWGMFEKTDFPDSNYIKFGQGI